MINYPKILSLYESRLLDQLNKTITETAGIQDIQRRVYRAVYIGGLTEALRLFQETCENWSQEDA